MKKVFKIALLTIASLGLITFVASASYGASSFFKNWFDTKQNTGEVKDYSSSSKDETSKSGSSSSSGLLKGFFTRSTRSLVVEL